MENTPDEAKLKELIKSAVVEALEERQDLLKSSKSMAVTEMRPGRIDPTVKVILLWVLILVVGVGLYNLVEYLS